MPAIELTATDGHRLSAWRADPAGTPKGGIVILQEAFGVNTHIRRVVEDYAKRGYVAIAPALFDRVERGVELSYGPDAWGKLGPLMGALTPEGLVLDTGAAVEALKPAGKVAVVGYCLGGRAAWLAAAHLPIAAAISYYGGGISKLLDLMPRCPVIMHFGEKDAHIPMSDVQAIQDKHPEMSIFTYPAGHGFNCEDRADYSPESAELALQRTLNFLEKELA